MITASTPGIRDASATSIIRDLGMGAIRAQETTIGLAGKIPIGGVAPLPRDQSPVFTPAFEHSAHSILRSRVPVTGAAQLGDSLNG